MLQSILLLLLPLLLLLLDTASCSSSAASESQNGQQSGRNLPELDPGDPTILSYLARLTNPDNLSQLEAIIRRQRQIRFKNSYQELPESLQTPLLDVSSGDDTAELSYFVQVDVDDPPSSTALTKLPKSAKTYFPPQLSRLEELLLQRANKDENSDRKGKAVNKVEIQRASLAGSSTSIFPPNPSGDKRTLANRLQNSVPLQKPNVSSAFPFGDRSHGKVSNHDVSLGSGNPLVTPHLTNALLTTSPSKTLPSLSQTPNFIAKGLLVSSSYTSYDPSGSQNSDRSQESVFQKSFSNSKAPSNVPQSSSVPSPASLSVPVKSKISHSRISPSHTTTTLPRSRFLTRSPSRTPAVGSSSSTSSATSLSFLTTSPSFKSSRRKNVTPPPRHLELPRVSSSFTSISSPSSPPPQQSLKSFSPSLSSSIFPSTTLLPKQPTVTPSRTRNRVSSSLKLPEVPPLPKLPIRSPQTSSRLFTTTNTFPKHSFQPLQTQLPSNKGPQPKPKSNSKSLVTNRGNNFLHIVDSIRGGGGGGSRRSGGDGRRTGAGNSRSGGSVGGSPQAFSTTVTDGKTQSLGNLDSLSYAGSIPGREGVDYPTFQKVPRTGFDCSSKASGGYFADPETNCQVFHVCWGRRSASFLCPVGTMFNQQYLVCDWWYNVDCDITQTFEELNPLSWKNAL